MTDETQHTQDPPDNGGGDPPQTQAKGGEPSKAVPYDRFKAVNDQKTALEAQLAALQAQIKEREDAGKSELVKLTERLSTLESDLTKERLQNLRMQVATEKGIPTTLVGRLQGSTREELEADADQLAAYIKPAPGPGAQPPPKGGQAATFDLSNKTPEEIRKAMAEGKIKF